MADDDATKREVASLLAWSRVADLRDSAAEVATAYRSLQPTPTLDVEWSQLDTDPTKRQEQLLLLWQVERRFRLRLQDNLRHSLEMLTGEPTVV